MVYYLQNRWVPEGKYLRYYGLRNRDNMFYNRIKPNKKQRQIIRLLPKELSSDEKNVLGRLLGAQIVPENELRRTPKSFSEARFCSTCCANDFLIPDIEFDENGQCRYVRRRKKLQMRTDVFYFSGSGNSRAVAVSVAEKLGAVPFDITEGLYSDSAAAETAAVVFPVYCQNVPPPVKVFLPTLRAERVALIATYGGISHGNVLNEAQKLISGTVVCGAYVPMEHSLLCDQIKFDISEISSLLKQINSLEPAVFPHVRKNVFADFFSVFTP